MRKGYSSIETVLIMILLAAFGMAVFVLAYTGGRAYKNMTSRHSSDNELRIAVSYVRTRLMNNNSAADIDLKQLPSERNGAETAGAESGNALVIRDNAGGSEYETWIYFHNGVLKELMTIKDENSNIKVDFEKGFKIAEIDLFNIGYGKSENEIMLQAGVLHGGIMNSIDTIVTLRAEGEKTD